MLLLFHRVYLPLIPIDFHVIYVYTYFFRRKQLKFPVKNLRQSRKITSVLNGQLHVLAPETIRTAIKRSNGCRRFSVFRLEERWARLTFEHRINKNTARTRAL